MIIKESNRHFSLIRAVASVFNNQEIIYSAPIGSTENVKNYLISILDRYKNEKYIDKLEYSIQGNIFTIDSGEVFNKNKNIVLLSGRKIIIREELS